MNYPCYLTKDIIRHPNKNKRKIMFSGESKKSEQLTELSQCEDERKLLSIIADEKCRIYRSKFGTSNHDSHIWGNEACLQASEEVVIQVEKCLSLHRKGHVG